MQLVCLLLVLLCGATAAAQDPALKGYPELRQVEQRIGDLNRRIEVVSATSTPDDRLLRALKASLAVWQDWRSLLESPASNEDPEARAVALEELRDLTLETRLALSSSRNNPLPDWVNDLPLDGAQRRVASELRPAMTIALQEAEAAGLARSRAEDRSRSLLGDLEKLAQRREQESAELSARLDRSSQPSDSVAHELFDLRVELLEQSLQQADLRETRLRAQLRTIDDNQPTFNALEILAKLKAELAEKKFLRAQERISARALEAAVQIEAQLANQEAPANEKPWAKALRQRETDVLRVRAQTLRLQVEESTLEFERTEMLHLRDEVEERLAQLEQMFLPGGPGLPADLALEELRRLERNADPQAFRGEVQALISHSQLANERYAAWRLRRDPSAQNQLIELEGYRRAWSEEGGTEAEWQGFLRNYVQAEAELANARARYGEALRVRAELSRERTDLRLEIRDLRLARRSLLRRENLLLRMPFRIRPAEMASEVKGLRNLPAAIGAGFSGIRDWFSSIEHAAALLAWLLLSGGLFAGSRRIQNRLEQWLKARRSLPAVDSDSEQLRLAWTRRAGVLAIAPLAYALAVALSLGLAARLLEGAHPGVQTFLSGLTWMAPVLFLAWRLCQLWFDADPDKGEPWGMSEKGASRTRRLLRVSLLLTTVILPVQLILTSCSTHATAWQDALGTLLTLGVGLGAYAMIRAGGPLSRMAPRSGRAAWFGRLFQLLRRILSVLVFGVVALEFLAFDFLVEQVVSSSLDLLVVAALVFVFHQAFRALLDRRMAQLEARQPSSGNALELPNKIATGPAFALGAPLMTLAVLNWTGWLDRWDLARLFDRAIPFVGLEADNPITWWMLGQALVVLASAVFIGRLAEFWLTTLGHGRTRHDEGLRYTASKLVSYCIIGLGAYLALTHLFDASKLGYVVAALSVGIGFGLQEIVSNFVSGLILLFERPLQVGDLIQVGATVGVVERINIRATTVRTLDNEFILVPNRELVTKDVVNHTHNDPRLRVRVPVGVAYGSDLKVVREAMLSAAQNNRLVLKRPAPEAFFKGFGDSSLDFELRAWISRPLDRPSVTSELNSKIDEAFRAAGVTIPFPQRDLHLRSVDDQAGQQLRGQDES